MKRHKQSIAASGLNEHFRAKLREEREQLRIALSKAEDRIRELNGADASQVDDPVPDCDCEYLNEAYKRQRDRLKSVVESLERIEEGTFGLCIGCNMPIGRKRLEVLPFARYCLSCQEELEHSASRVIPPGGSLLAAAF